MLFKTTVQETRTIDVEYVVDADNIDEARELFEKGETVLENEVDGQYEVVDRQLNEFINEIEEQSSVT